MKELSLRDNESLESLPAELGKAQALVEIDLTGTAIKRAAIPQEVLDLQRTGCSISGVSTPCCTV